jgi:hypothetical protein
MDLALFQYNDTAVMPVRDPNTGEPLVEEDGTPVTITLSGVDSAAYEKAQRDAAEARLNAANPIDPVVSSSMIMAKCTIAWTNIDYQQVKNAPCNLEHAFNLYKRLKWLREQVDIFVSARRNFMKVSSET